MQKLLQLWQLLQLNALIVSLSTNSVPQQNSSTSPKKTKRAEDGWKEVTRK